MKRNLSSVLNGKAFIMRTALLVGVMTSCAWSAEPSRPAVPVLEWRSIGHGGGGYHQVLVAAPNKPERMYLCIDVGGIYRSDDGGLHWSPIYAGLRYHAHHAQRVIRLAVSHQDADLFYTVTLSAGLWKSRDGGQTYSRVGDMTSTGGKGGRQIVVINPKNHDEVVFFASGRFHRTSDGGKTLQMLPNPGELKKISAVAAQFTADGKQLHLWIGRETELLHSTDLGQSWKPCRMDGWPGGVGYTGEDFTGRFLWNSRDKSTGQPVLLMYSAKNKGVAYRSNDFGRTWQPLPMPMEDKKPYYAHPERFDNSAIWVDPEDADRLAINAWPQVGFVTQDGGKTWIPSRSLEEHKSRYMDAMNRNMYANAYTFPLGVKDRIYARTMFSLYRSDDGGRRFYVISQRRLGKHHFSSTGEDGVYANLMTTDPSTGHLYLADDDVGVARSEDGGRSWHSLRYPVTEESESDHPGGLAGKETWNVGGLAGLVIDSSRNPTDIYAWITEATLMPNELEYFNRAVSGKPRRRHGIYVSHDQGRHFRFHSRYAGFPYLWRGLTGSFVLDPHSPKETRTFYLTVASGIFRSTDGGRNWKCLNEQIGKSLGLTFNGYHDIEAWRKRDAFFAMVRVDPHAANTVYATTILRAGRSGSRLPSILRSIDGGKTWTPIKSPVTSCWAFEISPHHPGMLYAADRDTGVFVSRDSGKTWNKQTDLSHVTNIVPSRRNSRLLYIASDAGYRWQPRAGVFRSTDAGKSWRDITGNLPHLRIMFLGEDRAKPGWLYVGTRGGGAFMGFDSTISGNDESIR